MLNLQGDIEKIYDSNGYVVVTYFYDAWGKLISIEDYSTDNIGVKNPLRYRGYYYDTETGFYYLQSRYYDPEICRFINADSLLIAGNDYIQGANMFVYCYNNPVMYVDPTGYANEELAANIIVIIGSLIYLSERVSFTVLMGYVISIQKLKFETTEKMANYIFNIAKANMPRDDGWKTAAYPYPIEVDKEKKTMQLIMDIRFLNKNYCLFYADRLIDEWGEDDTLWGMNRESIAIEIYGHAMMFYNFDKVKPAIEFIMNLKDPSWGTTESHAAPIDLGNNPPYYTTAFNIIWSKY